MIVAGTVSGSFELIGWARLGDRRGVSFAGVTSDDVDHELRSGSGTTAQPEEGPRTGDGSGPLGFSGPFGFSGRPGQVSRAGKPPVASGPQRSGVIRISGLTGG